MGRSPTAEDDDGSVGPDWTHTSGDLEGAGLGYSSGREESKAVGS